MTQRQARQWVGAVGVVLLLLVGCSLPSDGSDKASKDAAQVKVKHRLISRLEAVPGAKVAAKITSGLDAGVNNIGVTVHAPATATDAQVASLADRAERMIWLSHLDPLGRISIIVVRQGSPDTALQRLYQDQIDTRKLRTKYGPRPDHLSG
jgi:hypothetical protein